MVSPGSSGLLKRHEMETTRSPPPAQRATASVRMPRSSRPWAIVPGSPSIRASSALTWMGLTSPDASAYALICSWVTVRDSVVISSPTRTAVLDRLMRELAPDDEQCVAAAHPRAVLALRVHVDADEGHATLVVDAGDGRLAVDHVAGLHLLVEGEALLAVDEAGQVDADLGVAEDLPQRGGNQLDGG